MFPYPSGDGLHVGHPEGYTATDIYSRYLRMNGKKVLHPMGWDAFGLPAENAAIMKGIHPRLVTEQNIATFKRQIQALGFSYDWDREVNTTDPAYYKWTQWIFLQLFKRGLAYEKEAPIWWCPKDKTGLANEEVVNGKCDRCGTTVEKKMLKQWMLKITAYADRLLDGLEKLDWPEGIKTLQRNWIGKSEGAEVSFDLIPYTKVLVATNNVSKVARIRSLLKKVAPEITVVTPDDEGLSGHEVAEGSDLEANALAKARALANDTKLPVLGTDTGFFIDGEDHDPAMVKRNALNGRDERHVAQGEAAVLMLKHYQAIAKRHGGTVDAYWKDVFVLVLPNGQTRRSVARRDVTLTTKAHQPIDPFFPVRSLYINKSTGKYSADHTEEEEHQVALAPYVQALQSVLRPSVSIFTTRPDTLFGATYLVLSPEHPLVNEITSPKQKPAVDKYVKSVAAKSDLERTALEKEKIGVFTGAYAINPVNQEKIPVWIADYVLMSYGTGAIMAVPAHDERDHVFARQYKLPIVKVIKPPSVMPKLMDASAGILGVSQGDIESDCWTGEGTMMNSGQFNGLPSNEGRQKIVAMLTKEGKALSKVHYKLRDWVFSRQRYWGEPIPLVHCENCRQKVESTPHYLSFWSAETWDSLLSGQKTVETRALNPEESERFFGNIKPGYAQSENYLKGIFKPTGATAYFRVKNIKNYKTLAELFADKKTLAAVAPGKHFQTVKDLEATYTKLAPGYAEKIKKNGLIAFEVRHVLPGIILAKDDELPVLLPEVEKYEPTGTGESPLAAVSKWVNVTCRVCGHPATRETNTMPQWAGSCWYYLRFCDPHNEKDFASAESLQAWLPVEMYVGGAEHAVLHLLYARFWHKVLFDAGFIPKAIGDEPFITLKNQGLILGPDGEKMSKSRGNVINPDEIIEQYGADTLRMYEMFMGPFEDAKPWDTNGIVGVRRFLDKVWRASERVDDQPAPERWHRFAKQITDGITQFRFNTCVSDLMIWVNTWGTAPVSKEEFKMFLKLLVPFAPHLAEELWSRLGETTLLALETWPKFDPQKINEQSVIIAVQVMGKLRATIQVATGTDESAVREKAIAEPNVAKFLTSKPRKVIFVKDKLINFVV